RVLGVGQPRGVLHKIVTAEEITDLHDDEREEKRGERAEDDRHLAQLEATRLRAPRLPDREPPALQCAPEDAAAGPHTGQQPEHRGDHGRRVEPPGAGELFLEYCVGGGEEEREDRQDGPGDQDDAGGGPQPLPRRLMRTSMLDDTPWIAAAMLN